LLWALTPLQALVHDPVTQPKLQEFALHHCCTP
jgi:hypothetical protein